jgi:hypothetical protein
MKPELNVDLPAWQLGRFTIQSLHHKPGFGCQQKQIWGVLAFWLLAFVFWFLGFGFPVCIL